MSAHKLIIMRIVLNLARLGTAGRAKLATLVGQFAPNSAVYLAVPSVKEIADKVLAGGVDLQAKQKDVEVKKKAYAMAVVARDTSDQQLAAHLNAYRGVASSVCKAALEVEGLALSKAVPSPPVPLSAPTKVTAKAGKEKGSFTSHAVRIPGLQKYIVEVSVETVTATSFQQVAGTGAKRAFAGYESGKGYWIRYCTERGQQRSAWSDPVYVVAR